MCVNTARVRILCIVVCFTAEVKSNSFLQVCRLTTKVSKRIGPGKSRRKNNEGCT